MRVDKYGKPVFKKLYTSGAADGDSIEKAFAYEDDSFLVGRSTVGSTNSFFLITMGATGTVNYQLKIASDTTTIGTDSRIYQMYTTNGTTIITAFKGSVSGYNKDVLSIVTLGSTSSERYIGLSNQTNTQLLGAFINGSVFTILGVHNSKVFEMVYRSSNKQTSKARYLGSSISVATGDSLSLDMNPIKNNRLISFFANATDTIDRAYFAMFTENTKDYSTFNPFVTPGNELLYYKAFVANDTHAVDIFQYKNNVFDLTLYPINTDGQFYLDSVSVGPGTICGSVTSSNYIYASSTIFQETPNLNSKQGKLYFKI